MKNKNALGLQNPDNVMITNGGGYLTDTLSSWSSNSTYHFLQSPLFHIMKGQRELFHSNFIAWMYNYAGETIRAILANALKEMTKKAFEGKKFNQDYLELLGDVNTEINRELDSLDLPFQKVEKKDHKEKQLSKIFFLIENKFKDLPRFDQLEKYSGKKNLFDDAIKVTLSFEKTGESIHPLWRNINQGDFARELLNQLKNANKGLNQNNNLYNKHLVIEYAQMIMAINHFVDKNEISGKDGEEFKFLNTLLTKLKYSRYFNEIAQSLKSKNIKFVTASNKVTTKSAETGTLYIGTSYSRTGAMVEGIVKLDNQHRFIIQIQDNKYVRGLIDKTPDGRILNNWKRGDEEKKRKVNFSFFNKKEKEQELTKKEAQVELYKNLESNYIANNPLEKYFKEGSFGAYSEMLYKKDLQLSKPENIEKAKNIMISELIEISNQFKN